MIQMGAKRATKMLSFHSTPAHCEHVGGAQEGGVMDANTIEIILKVYLKEMREIAEPGLGLTTSTPLRRMGSL